MIEKEFTDLRVFLVEPSHTQQHIIKQFLLDLGISNITLLENGEKTIERLKQNSPDLIMSSMYLPSSTNLLNQTQSET